MSSTIEILIYRGEKLLGKREFQGELVTIGTAADSSLRFVGVPGVGEHHAMLWVENGGLTVAPSGGTPILWNGSPVSVARPSPNDYVSIGPLRLQVRLHGAPAMAAPPPGRSQHDDEDDEPKTLVVAQSSVRRSSPEVARSVETARPPDGGIDKLLGMLEMELAGTKPYLALPDDSPALTGAPEFEEATLRASSPRAAAEPPASQRGRQEPVFFPIGIDPHAPTAVSPVPRAPAPVPPAPPPVAISSMSAPTPLMPVAPPPVAAPPAPAPAPQAAKAPKPAKQPKPEKAPQSAFPAEAPAPRSARQMPTQRLEAIAPPPEHVEHEDDEEHEFDDDEETFAEPFSLLEQISADAGVAGGELALQVTVVRNRRLAGYHTLDRGGHYSPFHRGGAVVRHRSDGRAELAAGAQRTIRVRQSPSDAAQEVGAAQGSAIFAPGGSAIVRDAGTDLVVSFIRRPLQGKDRGSANTTVGATYGGGSLVVHMTTALVLTLMFGREASLERAAQAQLGQEPPDIEVGVTPPEAPPPPPPEAAPTPEEVPAPTAPPPMPVPSTRTAVRRIGNPNAGPAAGNPDEPPPQSAAEQSLAALENMSTGASSSTLREAIGSIDAAASSGGASAVFRVAGPVGQLPGGAVRIGRAGGGGGGPIETRDLRQVTKGGAIGGVGPVQGTRSVRGTVRGAGSRLGGQGTIDRAAVQRVILSHQGQIAACYERALLRDPGLAGRVVMAWSITPSGGVGNVSVGQSSLSNSAVTSCISAAVRGWRFPQPSGGSVTVTFPYVFRPVGM